MPSIQSIALVDRESTPVTHTFTPDGSASGVARVANKVSGIAVGAETLTISHRKGTKSKTKLVLVVPQVQTQTINGVSSSVVVRTAIAELNFTFDLSSTLQERKNLMGMVETVCQTSKTLVNDTVTLDQDVWGM